jgi:HSP20 family molecular chaperone IbpA
LKEVTMARPYLPSFFGRGDDPFGSLFREVQKTFEDFSQRTPFARFSADTLSPKIDIAESKDAIDVTAELPGVDEKDLDVTLANGMLTIRGEKRTERDERRILYLTYNAAAEGDHRARYFAEKRESFPPDVERRPGIEYKFRV